MKLIELQLAWFFASPQSPEYEKIASTLRSQLNVEFMHPAMILPIPPSAPAEIPRLQMTTDSGSNRFSMTPIRCDFFSSAISDKLSDSDVELFRSNAMSASNVLAASTIKISRLGIVGRLAHETDQAPKIIQNAFLRDTSRNIKELSLRIVERHVFEATEYNDSLQYEDGIRMPDNIRILVVTRDINTVPETPLDMAVNEIGRFLDFSLPKFSEELISQNLGV